MKYKCVQLKKEVNIFPLYLPTSIVLSSHKGKQQAQKKVNFFAFSKKYCEKTVWHVHRDLCRQGLGWGERFF